MSAAGWPPSPSPRTTSSPLVRAFGISVAVHFLLFGLYKTGNHYGLWQQKNLPAWVTKAAPLAPTAQKPKSPNSPPVESEPPMLFIDVNPTVATPEPPDKAKYYSARNSQAANPDPQKQTETPKIDGKQVHVPKTETVTKPNSVPTPPAAPPQKEPEPQKEIAAAEAKPKGGQAAGDLTKAKPELKPGDGQVTDGKGLAPTETPHQRPRTLAQAQAQKSDPGMVGEKMLQEGGVKRPHIAPSLDAKATPFGAYDAALIAAIENRWYALLQQQHFARDAAGVVVVAFRLNYDGQVSEMKVAESSVGDLLSYICERAISDPSPFAVWPSDMRRLVGKNYREVRFTFYYE